jgi:hypothetical protein
MWEPTAMATAVEFLEIVALVTMEVDIDAL